MSEKVESETTASETAASETAASESVASETAASETAASESVASETAASESVEAASDKSTVEIDRTRAANEAAAREAERLRKRAKLFAQPRVPKPRVWPLFLLALLVVAADQWLKWWIRFNIEIPGDTLPLWPGVVHWSHVGNWGAAWGVFAGARWPLVIASAAVCCAIVFFCRRIGASGRAALVAAGLILGGAVGNLIDRVHFGYVLDMIDMDTSVPFIRDFPIFNLADSALTLGVIVLLLMSFWPAPKEH